MQKEWKMRRIGLIRCPVLHPIPRNSVLLKPNEGIGSKIKVECGMCGKKFTGIIEKVTEEAY